MTANSKFNWLPRQMKLYVLQIISKQKEIRCEKCGSYKNLELHHKKYAPLERVSISDIQLLCGKCHRNNNHKYSKLSTVFIKDKRYCVGSNFKFAY